MVFDGQIITNNKSVSNTVYRTEQLLQYTADKIESI